MQSTGKIYLCSVKLQMLNVIQAVKTMKWILVFIHITGNITFSMAQMY